MLSVIDKSIKTNNNVIHFKILERDKIECNKDNNVNKKHSNKVAGVSSEVYPFTTEEEIKMMIDLFNNRINKALDENKKQIAYRNKMLFVIGINVGLRASDLITLKWNFFFNNDRTFKEFYILQPKKTKKQKKFVKLFFNQTVKKAIMDYIQEYPIQDMDDYLFKSRKGNKHITEISLGRIIKNAADEVGINKNICSHSLRKTWGYFVWHKAKDKSKALVILQQCFNHSDSLTTMKYIGIMDEEKKEMYESIDLGLDYL